MPLSPDSAPGHIGPPEQSALGDRHPRGVFEFPAPDGYRSLCSVDSAGKVVEEYQARAEACRIEHVYALMMETLDRIDPPGGRPPGRIVGRILSIVS